MFGLNMRHTNTASHFMVKGGSMKIIKREGKVIVKKIVGEEKSERDCISDLLNLEVWLNDKVAIEANKKFGVMLRVHI